ncbi:MAG: hypothetical protein ABI723_16495 [Bacteroidia bacterium]
MKIKLTLLLTFATQFLLAQKTQVTEVTESIGGGSNPGYSIYIENVDPKKAEKEWSNYIKDHDGKSASSKGLGGQVVFENVKIAAVGSEPLKIYAKLIKDKNAIRITAAFAKPGSFISSSSDPGADRAVQKLMYDFAVNFKKKLVGDELNAAAGIQKKNQDKQKSLEKNIEANRKDITYYENKIITAKQGITHDSTAVEQMKIQIATQDSTIQIINLKLKDID